MDETQKKMLKKWAPWAVVGLLVLLVVGGTVGTYNDLVEETEGVEAQARQVDVAYQRAFRLIPDLTDLAEQYMASEVDVIENVTAMRSGLARAEDGSLQTKDAYMQDVVDFVALVGNRAEAYPELQSAQLFQDTMTEMINSENKIAAEKVRYNDRVQELNSHLKRCCLPRMVAGMFGFEEAAYIGFEGRPTTSAWEGGDY